MKTTKLQQQDIEQALAAARKMLGEEASWITKSALLEWAYFIGLYAGLRSLSSEEAMHRSPIPLGDTFWARSGDDTFEATKMGGVYASMKKDLQEWSNDLPNSLIERLTALRQHLENLDDRWQRTLRETWHILGNLEQMCTPAA